MEVTSFSPAKKGSSSYQKMSYPVHCGIYSELKTTTHVFHFNGNHEILRVKALGERWNHPHEWLKRTIGNDWVYYSTGGYTGVFEALGEYYLPNQQYSTNTILGGHPFKDSQVEDLTHGWYDILRRLRDSLKEGKIPGPSGQEVEAFLANALCNTPDLLAKKAARLHEILGGRISVLPPDARHVDYNLIPLLISRGCLYKCRFCKVKNEEPFQQLSPEQIDIQLDELQRLFAADLINYNSLYLGDHDALNADPELIITTLQKAVNILGLQASTVTGTNAFFFGSVGSLLLAKEEFFAELNQLGIKTYINIGLEAADQKALAKLGKPIDEKGVVTAFLRMLEINNRYLNIEVTANFIMDEALSAEHYPKILALIRDTLPRKQVKGAIYFSPLRFDEPSRDKLFAFNRLKIKSRLPTFLYIIQRL